METIIFQIQSACILSLILYGITLPKKNRELHRKFMLSAIIWDLILILQIELSREAVKKATQMLTNTWLLNYHIGIAVSCVLGYFILIYTGTQIFKGRNHFKKWHKPIAYVVVLFRISTFITSFIIK